MIDFITYILSRKYTESYVAKALSGIIDLEYRVVDVLPEQGEKGVIYLVPNMVHIVNTFGTQHNGLKLKMEL